MSLFPYIVARHPAADLGLDGVESHLVQAGDQQFVFMHFLRGMDVPEHAHAAQWGVVLEGEMELVIHGEVRLLRKGDSYFIPAGVPHRARIHPGYTDITLFDQADRYALLTPNPDASPASPVPLP